MNICIWPYFKKRRGEQKTILVFVSLKYERKQGRTFLPFEEPNAIQMEL